MSKVLCFGEALIDFLNIHEHCDDGLNLPEFRQYPGGAPANAAVAAAKLGANAAFVGQVGNDMFGDFLANALAHYGVDCDYLLRHETAKTALAFVSRDKTGERKFSFYRDGSADLLFPQQSIKPELFDNAKVVHICSNTLTHDDIAMTTRELLRQAASKGLLVSFDVNLRHNLWQSGSADRSRVNQFVAMADVLKFSREEIEYLTQDIDGYVESLLENQAKLIVITNDGGAIHFYSKLARGVINAPKVEVVDTTAGGDGFSGGLLYLLSQIENLRPVLADKASLEQIIHFAAACGGHAVTKPGAFPALPVMADVEQSYPTFLR